MYGLAKLAAGQLSLDELEQKYNEAFTPSSYQKHKRGGFLGFGGRTYRTPIYTPDQEEKQLDFHDFDYDKQVLDHFGQQALKSGTYNGPAFNDLFEGVYPLNNEGAALVRKYPRLLDAMKQDTRTDRGGIVFNFQESLEASKHDPATQQRIYRLLQHELDNKQFYGWKRPIYKDDFDKFYPDIK